jgi:type II secretory pathway predicted ATPase ExeA
MMEMFKARYQLNGDPFAKSLPTKDAFASADFKEATTRLEYLTKTRGLALITAAPGYGKTFCIRTFAERQNANLVKIVYLSMSTVSVIEFYRQLAVALGLEQNYRKADLFREIKANLEYLLSVKKIHAIIVIDEAQYLNTAILRDLKMLMNFDYDSRDRFSLVLSGQPMLADMLSRQIHEALRQRIIVNYEFQGITETEAADYAKKMVTLQGGAPSIFDEAALHAAYNNSNGSIRVFGKILSRSLMIGAQADANSITSEMVMGAANEIEIR